MKKKTLVTPIYLLIIIGLFYFTGATEAQIVQKKIAVVKNLPPSCDISIVNISFKNQIVSMSSVQSCPCLVAQGFWILPHVWVTLRNNMCRARFGRHVEAKVTVEVKGWEAGGHQWRTGTTTVKIAPRQTKKIAVPLGGLIHLTWGIKVKLIKISPNDCNPSNNSKTFTFSKPYNKYFD